MYRIFKKLDVFVKAYPYLSLIRCLVHYILDSLYFRFMLNVLLSQYEYDLVWSYVF